MLFLKIFSVIIDQLQVLLASVKHAQPSALLI